MQNHKAIITQPPDEAILAAIRDAGFNGVEANWMDADMPVISRAEAEKVRAIADRLGVRVHCVLRGWAEYNSPESAKIKADQDYTIATMRAAQGYGADAVLLVPGRIGGMPMPERGKFKITFDPGSGHVTSAADGDNTPYREYIQAHNHAWDAFRKEILELIPVAEETGVVIAVENVWNNLFMSPEHFAAFVDSFKSSWVKAYFDVANHLVYGPPPQDWIRVLGKRLVKIHIKDFKLGVSPEEEWPPLRQGSVPFPKVMEALQESGYDGWLTIEGPCGDYRECCRRLELILAGK
jgi:hexulose-6-phosphate isomerase